MPSTILRRPQCFRHTDTAQQSPSSSINWAGMATLPSLQITVCLTSCSSVVSIPIGQALLLSSLRTEIPRLTTAVRPESVILAGASGLETLAAGDLQILQALRQAYAISLRGTYILALAAGCAALVFTFGLEWKNLKTIDRERKNDRNAIGEARGIKKEDPGAERGRNRWERSSE